MPKYNAPHISIPFRIDGTNGAVAAEQDSEREIMDCVEVVLRYPQGHRPEKPEFGIPDLTFHEHPDERRIQEALVVWEPRIEMAVSQPVVDIVDELLQRIRIERDTNE